MSILSTFEINPNNQYEQLFYNASIGIVIVDQKGMIINGNNFFLSMFGYEADEIKNKPIEFIIPSRYHHNHVANREDFYKNPVSRPMGLGKSLFGKRKMEANSRLKLVWMRMCMEMKNIWLLALPIKVTKSLI